MQRRLGGVLVVVEQFRQPPIVESGAFLAPVAESAGDHEPPVHVPGGVGESADGEVHEAALRGERRRGRQGFVSEPVADFEGPAVKVQGVLGGKGGSGLVAGLDEVGQRLVELAAFPVVVGQCLVLLRQPIAVQLLDGGGHHAVKRAPPFDKEGRVGHLVGQGMLEHVGQLGEVDVAVDQLERFEFGQDVGQLGALIRDAFKQTGGELAADDRRQLQGGLRRAGEPVNPGQDDLLDGPGDPDLVNRSLELEGAISPGEDAALQERTDDLFDVEGIALGFVGHQLGEPGRRLGLQDATNEVAALGPLERDERDPGRPEAVGEGVFGAGGEEQQHGAGRDRRYEPQKGLLGRLVDPVQVLDQQDGGAAPPEFRDKGAQRLAESGSTLARVDGGQGRVARVDAQEEAQVGHGANAGGCDPAGGPPGEAVDDGGLIVGLLDTERGFDDFGERQVWDVPAVGHAVPLQPCHAVVAGGAAEFGDEAGLAEAGLPRHEGNPAAGAAGSGQLAFKDSQFSIAADERRQPPLGRHLEAGPAALLPHDAVELDRLGFAFHAGRTERLAVEVVDYHSVGRLGEEDLARSGQRLHPGGEVDGIPDGGHLHGQLVAHLADDDRPGVEPDPEAAPDSVAFTDGLLLVGQSPLHPRARRPRPAARTPRGPLAHRRQP